MTASEPIAPVNLSAAIALLRSLISERKLVKAALDTAPVAVALNFIGEAARSGGDHDRLETISLLAKISEISKPLSTLVRPLIGGALTSPLPNTGKWGSADDRYYLAIGVSQASEVWITQYAAVELAQGDIAERLSREVWAEIAMHRATSSAIALETIAQALAEDKKALKYSSDTTSRKLIRIVNAISKPLSVADVPLGEGFGRALLNLVYEVEGRTIPLARPLREEVTISFLDFSIQVLRLKLAAAFDSEVYRAIGEVLKWWQPARPPETIVSKVDRIVHIAMGALHTLARQGVTQRHLRSTLVSIFGSQLVSKIGAQIVANDPSIDPAIASWLSKGESLTEIQSNLAVRETNERAFDELVAHLLTAIESNEGGPQALELAADSIELLEPESATTIRSGAMRAKLIAQWALAIASKRQLCTSNQRGDLVSYDPALHDTIETPEINSTVRIRVPGVTKQLKDRPASIVLKAQVEKP